MNDKNQYDEKISHASVVERNIKALIHRKHQEERNKKWHDLIADSITKFAGSFTFVLIHLVLFLLWVVINLGWTPLPKFDPSFVILSSFASVEAIFLSTFVLISQNRMAALADKRADLDLQVSLLAEREITRLVTLVKAIAEKLDIDKSQDPELPELEIDVNPEKVLDFIQAKEEEIKKRK